MSTHEQCDAARVAERVRIQERFPAYSPDVIQDLADTIARDRAALTAHGWWVATDPDGTVRMGNRDGELGDYEDVDYAWQCAGELAEVRDDWCPRCGTSALCPECVGA